MRLNAVVMRHKSLYASSEWLNYVSYRTNVNMYLPNTESNSNMDGVSTTWTVVDSAVEQLESVFLATERRTFVLTPSAQRVSHLEESCSDSPYNKVIELAANTMQCQQWETLNQGDHL